MTDNEDRNTLDYDCCNAPVERAIRAEHPPRLPVFLIFGAGKELSQVQKEYLVDVIMTWIEKELSYYDSQM